MQRERLFVLHLSHLSNFYELYMYEVAFDDRRLPSMAISRDSRNGREMVRRLAKFAKPPSAVDFGRQMKPCTCMVCTNLKDGRISVAMCVAIVSLMVTPMCCFLPKKKQRNDSSCEENGRIWR